MSVREALAAALDRFTTNWHSGDFKLIAAAARRQLPLTPETCGTCGGRGWAWSDDRPNYGEQRTCPTCRGRGTVYPPALVERIASVVASWHGLSFDGQREAVAVLDALNSGVSE